MNTQLRQEIGQGKSEAQRLQRQLGYTIAEVSRYACIIIIMYVHVLINSYLIRVTIRRAYLHCLFCRKLICRSN